MPDRDERTRHALRARLRELVAATAAGERLPSERDLSERWRVARMTVRNATDALVAEGLVERRHGSGTYVVAQPFVRFLGLSSFSRDMRQQGLTPTSRLLAFDIVHIQGVIAGQLRVGPGEPVVRFTRLRLGSGEPMAIETVWAPASLLPGLAPSDLDGSLYELLSRRYQIVPASARVTIEPVLPDPATREALAIPAHQACLRLRMIDTDANGRVIMIADCTYRGDRFQLTADIAGANMSSIQARWAG